VTAAGMRAWRGPALFSFGFRPFFLFGAIWAALAAPLWVLVYLASGQTSLGGVGLSWHIHEMLFGYLAAVMAGFLLTAVPNWTGRLPVTGWPLAALFGLWVLGRIAMLAMTGLGAATASAIDSLFLLVFAGLIWREVIAGRNWRNLAVCGLVSLFALSNIAFHLGQASQGLADLAERLALAAPAMLIAVIGGRITPSFTRNWLAQRRGRNLPAPTGRIDAVVLALTGAALAAWVTSPGASLAGTLLVLAGLANGLRLARWRGLATLTEPLVWSLHAGYGWLATALVLLGSSVLTPLVPLTAGIHALSAGAFGVMTLAVMTRASLGHTGRARAADAWTLGVYLCVNVAAILRLTAAFEPSFQAPLLTAAALAWAAAFLGFAAVYGPMLASPRTS
jgi:uncharacterized protein involved in response to NO